jgi:hypothetical protein
VQPHRGNHTTNVDQDDYKDDLEPMNYHVMVSKKLKNWDCLYLKNAPEIKKLKAKKLERNLTT